MSNADSRFSVIEGGGQPIAGTRKKRKGDPVMCLCRTCQADIGVATNNWIKVRLGVMERAGRLEGGTWCYACAMCLARGKITRAT